MIRPVNTVSTPTFDNIKEKITDLIRNKNAKIPTLPVIAQNILTVTRNEKTSANDLAKFIDQDQAIANKVLKLSNSSYYGVSRKVDSIVRAITVVGFNEIVGLTVGVGILPALKIQEVQKILKMEDLWLHAIACCFAAKEIDRLVSLKSTSHKGDLSGGGKSVFLTALLHDIGKVIFTLNFPQEYAFVLKKAGEYDAPLEEMEKEILGNDHAQLAARIMDIWNFPENIIVPIRYHHMPDKCKSDYQQDAFIVSFANYIVHKVRIGDSANRTRLEDQYFMENLKLDEKNVKYIYTQVKAQRADIENFFNVMK